MMCSGIFLLNPIQSCTERANLHHYIKTSGSTFEHCLSWTMPTLLTPMATAAKQHLKCERNTTHACKRQDFICWLSLSGRRISWKGTKKNGTDVSSEQTYWPPCLFMHDRISSTKLSSASMKKKCSKNSNYWSKCTPEWQRKKRKGGDQEEDGEGPGGITGPDYAHSISPSERESFGPHRPIQLPPAWGKTVLRSSQDTQHKANMLTYREAETAQISELNTNRQSVRNHCNIMSLSAKHTQRVASAKRTHLVWAETSGNDCSCSTSSVSRRFQTHSDEHRCHPPSTETWTVSYSTYLWWGQACKQRVWKH